ncbi:hypothetical protein NE865_04218 [Phthorimaea operculella]|nr:hypothetical protein NE865_04218 [Phthorimaea operculella]
MPKFPSDLTLRNQWLENMNALKWFPNSTHFLCSKHFEFKSMVFSHWRNHQEPSDAPDNFALGEGGVMHHGHPHVIQVRA